MSNEATLKGDLFKETIEQHHLSEYFPHVYIPEREMTIFQSKQILDNDRKITITVSIDNTIYNKCSFLLLDLDEKHDSQTVLHVLNQLNNRYPNLKFILNPKNEIELEFMYIANSETFDDKLLLSLLRVTVEELSKGIFDYLLKHL